MKEDRIAILHETLQILKQGEYETGGNTVKLKLTRQQMEESHVLLPEDVKRVCQRETGKNYISPVCEIDCVPLDSYAAAFRMSAEEPASKPVLVLNFANPVNIGGGVYHGAKAQEEDLCRRSSLLASLESEHASRYYRYNRGLRTYMGSDAMIFSPQVEVFRDEHGELMKDTFVAAVLTCAAPMINYGTEGMSEEEYRAMFYNRILGTLKCAAHFGYDRLVLGAWGCGAFGNDAKTVSDLFRDALKELYRSGGAPFKKVLFAIRTGDHPTYNYREFYRNFGGGHFSDFK